MVAGIIFWVCQSVSKTKNEYKKNIGSAHTQKKNMYYYGFSKKYGQSGCKTTLIKLPWP